MTETSVNKKNADLPARVASAVVMVAIAGTALYLGGPVWALFVAVVAAGVLVEWSKLVLRFVTNPFALAAWHLGGLLYVALGCFTLLMLRGPHSTMGALLAVLATVVAVDVGAYFTGRTFGGPKIAPAISPSKTWSGLLGASVAATLALWLSAHLIMHWDLSKSLPLLVAAGPVVAVVAQTGDFFESWMKRRAGVKDSGKLIPGHGGLFDRVDGLLAVCFIIGLIMAGTILLALARGESFLPSPA